MSVLQEYVEKAMARRCLEELEGGGYTASIPELPGVWADGATEAECVSTLREVLEEWLVAALRADDELPDLDGVSLNFGGNRWSDGYRTGSSLAGSIEELGSQLVTCLKHCPGIVCDPAIGSIPRGLVLEVDGRTGNGAVVVGIGPGRPGKGEKAAYAKGMNYGAVLDWWRAKGRGHTYHERLRHLVDQLGFTGPILWTELAKCETRPGGRSPPLHTLKTCSSLYLRQEIAATPQEWPLVAAGKEPFKALAYLFPSRTVFGVPHPTGSFGGFHKLLLPGRSGELGPLRRDLKQLARVSRASTVAWLGT